METHPVFYQNVPVGQIILTPQPDRIRFTADCMLQSDAVLRLWAVRGTQSLRLGLPIPENGHRRLDRIFTGSALRDAGFSDLTDTSYLLSALPPTAAPTLPARLQTLLRSGAIMQRPSDGALLCPFDPSRPCPLAFALTVCTVSDGFLVLSSRFFALSV